MNDINIVYDIEKECGLEEKIRSQSSIAFTSPLCKFKEQDLDLVLSRLSFNNSSFANVDDDQLYHVYSILVSTVWNRNDDVFDKKEVWAARNTPRFKPTNLEHDEKQMVGGIVDSWPVDINLNLIADDTNIDDLPDEYHLLVSSVIYRQWQDSELKSRAENLISEIEAGTKFVSMECLFRGFDYGVTTPEGNNHIVSRNESTAFLTQHLKAYGGPGIYQDHKVGRVLRKISFSGKGFVDRPANPDSVIFDKTKTFTFSNVKNDQNLFYGVSVNTEEQFENNLSTKEIKQMSSDILNDQIKELKEALASVKAENKELSEKLSEANLSSYEAKIKELEAAVAESDSNFCDLDSKLVKATEKCESLEKELAEKTEALDKVESEMHKMHEDKKKKDRKDKMVEAGLSEEEAEVKYDTFANLDDDAFEVFVSTIAEMHNKTKAEEEVVAEEAEAEEEIVEETEASDLVEETEEGDHAVSSETEEDTGSARAGLQQWVEDCIMNNKSK